MPSKCNDYARTSVRYQPLRTSRIRDGDDYDSSGSGGGVGGGGDDRASGTIHSDYSSDEVNKHFRGNGSTYLLSERAPLLGPSSLSLSGSGFPFPTDLTFTMGKEDMNPKKLESGGSKLDDVPKKTTSIQAMMHLLKANVGTGILAIPDAFKNAGLYGGLLTMPLFAIVCSHCMHLLMSANSIVDRRLGTGMVDYAELTEAAFSIGPRPFQRMSKVGRFLVNFSLNLTQFGFCCVYTLFVAESILTFVNEITKNSFNMDVRLYLLILLPLFIAISLVRSLHALSLFSAFSNVLLCVGFAVIFWKLFESLPSVDSVPHVASITNFPLYMGTAIYAFEGIGVILPLQQDMADPKQLKGKTGVVNTAMAIVACLNTGIGFFGYLKYGDEIKGSITLNMPGDQTLYQAIKLVFAVAIFLTYPIQYYVPYNIIWPWAVEKYELGRKYGETWRLRGIDMATRAIIVTVTVGLAAAIPKLELFISLVGAFAASNLALIFPPLIDICANWSLHNKIVDTTQINNNNHSNGHHNGNGSTNRSPTIETTSKASSNLRLIIAKDIVIFSIGIIGFTTGTYASIVNIITKYND